MSQDKVKKQNNSYKFQDYIFYGSIIFLGFSVSTFIYSTYKTWNKNDENIESFNLSDILHETNILDEIEYEDKLMGELTPPNSPKYNSDKDEL